MTVMDELEGGIGDSRKRPPSILFQATKHQLGHTLPHSISTELQPT